MFTYKNASYKIFALDPKFCWACPACSNQGQGPRHAAKAKACSQGPRQPPWVDSQGSPHGLGLANENLRS